MRDEDPIEPTLDPLERPSKSEKKRQLDRLKIFADELVALPAGRLARLNLPDELSRSLAEARRIESRSALKRQLQHLGGLLEGIDVAAIRASLADMDHTAPKKATPVVAPEDPAVTELLERGDAAIFALSERYARDELQTLRQAVRLAKKQLEKGVARTTVAKSVATCLARLGRH